MVSIKIHIPIVIINPATILAAISFFLPCFEESINESIFREYSAEKIGAKAISINKPIVNGYVE